MNRRRCPSKQLLYNTHLKFFHIWRVWTWEPRSKFLVVIHPKLLDTGRADLNGSQGRQKHQISSQIWSESSKERERVSGAERVEQYEPVQWRGEEQVHNSCQARSMASCLLQEQKQLCTEHTENAVVERVASQGMFAALRSRIWNIWQKTKKCYQKSGLKPHFTISLQRLLFSDSDKRSVYLWITYHLQPLLGVLTYWSFEIEPR